MNKIAIVLIIVSITAVSLFGESAENKQWNVVIYPLQNKTDGGREESLKLVIQKSIITFLGQVSYLKISAVPGGASSLTAALDETYRNGDDVLIMGSYAVIDDRIYIYISVYDALQRQLKFETSYSGKAGAEIFDTIDEIVANLKQDLTKAVKPMDEETFVKYRKRVELVSEDVKLPRSFVTSIGWNSALHPGSYTGIPFIAFDSRLDWFNFGANFFVPLLIPHENSMEYWMNNYIDVYGGFSWGSRSAHFSYQFTVGAGLLMFYTFVSENNNMNGGMFGPMAYISCDLARVVTIKASMAFPNVTSSDSGKFAGMVPVYGGGLDWYFSEDFGIKFEVYHGSYQADSTQTGDQGGLWYNTLFLLGLDYRVDFK